jgi:hypothetical protein
MTAARSKIRQHCADSQEQDTSTGYWEGRLNKMVESDPAIRVGVICSSVRTSVEPQTYVDHGNWPLHFVKVLSSFLVTQLLQSYNMHYTKLHCKSFALIQDYKQIQLRKRRMFYVHHLCDFAHVTGLDIRLILIADINGYHPKERELWILSKHDSG